MVLNAQKRPLQQAAFSLFLNIEEDRDNRLQHLSSHVNIILYLVIKCNEKYKILREIFLYS